MTDENFNPYSPPASGLDDEQGRGGVWRRSRHLVMQEDAILPKRCCRCNAEAAPTILSIRVFWTLPWLPILLIAVIFVPVVGWMLFLLGLLILAVLRMRKNTRVEYAICQKHNRIRWILTLVGVFMLLISLSISIWIVHGSGQLMGIDPDGIVLLVGGGVMILGTMIAGVGQSLFRPRVKRYTDDKIWLTGFGKPFLNSLELFLQEKSGGESGSG